MKKIFSLLLLAVGCLSSDSDECIFEGKYELGGLSVNGCEHFSTIVYHYGESEECSSQESNYGNIELFSMSCEPGNPVVECDGVANYKNGCSYTTYIRRIYP